MYAFAEHLRPRKRSDNLKRGILCLGRSPLHWKMFLKGQNEGSCYVSGKLSNSQGILMVIFQLREGDKYVGELLT